MRKHVTTTILLGMGLLASTPTAARAQYLPLVQGYQWRYTGTGPITIDRAIDGVKLVGEAQTSVLSNVQTGAISDAWDNFWTSDAEGRLWLHGFFNYGSEFGIRYVPPILWIDASPQTDDTWNTTTTAFDLDTGALVTVFSINFQATNGVEVTVPAGTFDTLMLDYITESAGASSRYAGIQNGAALRDHTLLGQRRGTQDTVARASALAWYSDGLGLVRESVCCPSEISELTAYKTVATQRESWSSLKSTFGN